MPRIPISIVGNRYGRLVVTKFISRNKFGNSRWECVCDCGKAHEALYQNLKLGRVRSCGCMGRAKS